MKKLVRKPILFALVVTVIVMPLTMVAAQIFANGLEAPMARVTVETAVQSLLVVGFALLVKRKMPEGFALGFGCSGLGLSLLLGLPFLAEVVLYALHGYFGRIPADTHLQVYLQTVIMAFRPGFTEEILFRGLLFGIGFHVWQEKPFGLIKAVILSSLFFSGTHLLNLLSGQSLMQTVSQLLFTMGTGFLLAAAYARSRNLLGPIILHVFHDSVGYLLLQFVPQTGGGVNLLEVGLYVIWILLAVFLLRPSVQGEIRKRWGFDTAENSAGAGEKMGV